MRENYYYLKHPEKTNQEIDKICLLAYEKAWNFWKSFGIVIPDDIHERTSFKHEGFNVHIRPKLCKQKAPRICDVEIPPDLEPFLKTLGETTGYGDQTFLIKGRDLFSRYKHTDAKKYMELIEAEAQFYNWYPEVCKTWYGDPKSNGQHITISGLELGDRGLHLGFDFYPKKTLRNIFIAEFCFDRPYGQSPRRDCRAHFKSGQLFSLWQEGFNGELFEEPRVDIEDEGDETEEALDVLPDYDAQTQVFYFRKTRQEPGFKAEVGYRDFHKYGDDIRRHPLDYQRLSPAEIMQRLAAWNPNEVLTLKLF